ncbi:FUSC family protein [Piscinibacter sp. XHJ-5]|uniref:FUSC family protein n=1 Tax=Piscinibacter sp. XHJ-5 TaxID=3037797 RepID=UPI002452AED1|nr:FUSC family protein [Piscinibacter sp. XHJ-5]
MAEVNDTLVSVCFRCHGDALVSVDTNVQWIGATGCGQIASLMNAFNARGVAFAIKTAAAAIAAVLLALWFNLTNPGWAVLTVFLTSQQLGAAAGAVVSRSVYRALGTLLGVAGTLFVIPAFIAAPELLLLGVAGWVGLCLYLSLLDRSPRSYVFLLAAYTLPLIGMPMANNPSSIFDVALWRAEEIALGAALSMAVHTVFAPRSVKPLLVARVHATVGDARRWLLEGLGPDPTDDAQRRARERLGADLAEMGNLAVHLRFEPGITARDIAIVTALEERLLALLPLLAGVEDRLPAIRATDARLGSKVDAHLKAVRLHLERPLTRADAVRLGASGKALIDAEQPELANSELLLIGAMERLAELLAVWNDSLSLLQHLDDSESIPEGGIRRLLADASRHPRHVDHALAAWSGLTASLAVVVAGAICWTLGWDQGAAAVGLAASSSSIFAALDDPRPGQKVLLGAAVLGAIPIAAVYVFAVLPVLDGPVELALAVAPLFFVIALYLATPRLGLAALGVAIIWLTLVALQPMQTGDFWSFTTTAMAAVLGSTVALVVTSLVRVIGAETRVRRLLRAAWRDLAAMADDTNGLSRAAWGSRMLDRIGLLLPRMAATSGVLRAQAGRALDDLRIGVNMLDLRHAGLAAKPEVRTAIESALTQIGVHFRQRLERPDIAPAATILDSIDRAIARLVESDPDALRVQGLTAATGLRLGLFPPSRVTSTANGAPA